MMGFLSPLLLLLLSSNVPKSSHSLVFCEVPRRSRRSGSERVSSSSSWPRRVFTTNTILRQVATTTTTTATDARSYSSTSYDETDDRMPYDDIARAYHQWRHYYHVTEISAERFENFKVNYISMTKANEAAAKRASDFGLPTPPRPMYLNEYGDCSMEEFKVVKMAGGDVQHIIDAIIVSAAAAEEEEEAEKEDFMDSSSEYEESTLPEMLEKSSLTKSAASEEPEFTLVESGSEEEEEKMDTSAASQILDSAAGLQGLQELEQEAEDGRIRTVYQDWCNYHGKTFDESRLATFAANYNHVKRCYKESGQPVSVNKYADLTPEEYMELQKQSNDGSSGNDSLSNETTDVDIVVESLPSSSSLYLNGSTERIRKSYGDWCSFYGKDADESRFESFATNFLNLEGHHNKTGEPVLLDDNADLTPEEFQKMQHNTGQIIIPSHTTASSVETPSVVPEEEATPVSSVDKEHAGKVYAKPYQRQPKAVNVVPDIDRFFSR